MSNKKSEEQQKAKAKKEESEGGIFNRLGEIPIVNSALSVASTSYNKVKDASPVTKLGLSLAELSIKTAVNTTKFAYSVVPKPGFVFEVEKKVCEADAIACQGLDALQATFPYVMTNTEEIVSSGVETLEKSEVLEAALIVSEAAIDYIKPPVKASLEAVDVGHGAKSCSASVRKVDRMVDVSKRAGSMLYEEGTKMFWSTVSVPWNVTKAGYDVMAGAVSYIPGLSAFLSPRRKLRRSARRRTKPKPDDIVSFPFPSSPERKRKRSDGENESETIELLYCNNPYDSNDDPDYDPTDDLDRAEGSGSDSSDTVEASEDSDDDSEDDDDDDDDDSGEGDEAETSLTGGKTFKPEEVSIKSPKSGSDAHALKGAGKGATYVKENKEAIEKKKRTSSTEKHEKDPADMHSTTPPNSSDKTDKSHITEKSDKDSKSNEKEQSPPVIAKGQHQDHRRSVKEAGPSKSENFAPGTLANGATSPAFNGMKTGSGAISVVVDGERASSNSVNGSGADSAAVNVTTAIPTRSGKSPGSNASSIQRNYASKLKERSPKERGVRGSNEAELPQKKKVVLL